MPRPILILSERNDEHARRVAQLLERRGSKFLWVDPGEAPDASELTFELQPSRQHCSLAGFEVHDVGAAWYRRPGKRRASTRLPSAELRALAAAECDLLVRDLLGTISCNWIPAPYDVIRSADRKLSQLVQALAAGFEIPPTLVTSDSAKLWEFYRAHDGRLISKLPNHAFFSHVKKYMRYTNRVTASDMANAESMQLSPVIVQAEVPKAIEVRVTVVGTRAFSVGIHSQVTRRTDGDWRRYSFGRSGTPHEVHQLPAAVEAQCVALTQKLGLAYAAIDLVLTPEGKYVFLELNPNGQWLWLELTHIPISEAMCGIRSVNRVRSW